MSAKREPRWLWGVLVAALVVLVAATLLRGRQSRLLGGETAGAASGTASGVDVSGRLADYGPAPDFNLVSQSGEQVTLEDLEGRVWIADFIFTHCSSSCPMMNAQLERLVRRLSTPVQLVSFSVDPERDTPEKLAEYASAYDAGPNSWLFLTGDKKQLRRLVRDGFHLPVEDASPEDVAAGAESVLHSTRFVLVDAEGRIRGYYDGLDDWALVLLGEDVATLQARMDP